MCLLYYTGQNLILVSMPVVCLSDGANWLGSFCAPVKRWSGLLLRRPIDMEKRELIQCGEASLLDLRSYLFSRQCTLLIFLQRPWEVTQRALELLHNCVQELRLLEVQCVFEYCIAVRLGRTADIQITFDPKLLLIM